MLLMIGFPSAIRRGLAWRESRGESLANLAAFADWPRCLKLSSRWGWADNDRVLVYSGQVTVIISRSLGLISD